MTNKIDEIINKLDNMQVDISSILADTPTIGLSQPSYTTNTWPIDNNKCVCCERSLGLPNNGRGLCDACEEDIPNHIPEKQYLTYMKELWRKK